MTSGRLDDELRRMSVIAGQIGPHCLMLFNESFAGTNEREGSEIGHQVVRALLEAQIKVFFVTHRFDFAERFHRQHAGSTLFLRAERQPDGRRNYKLAVKEPLPTSYGEDLYYRLGGWLDEEKAFTPAAARSSPGRRTGRRQPDAAGAAWVGWKHDGGGARRNRGPSANGSYPTAVGGPMRGSGGSDPLLAALEELVALGSAGDRGELDALRGRLRDRRLRVLVAGEAKRGKSTLVNAMLSRSVLPAGVTPLTALATTVRYGSDENVRAVFADGHAEKLPLSALGDLVTERGNPGNCRSIASVTVSVDAPILARGVELVYTPGTGSVYAHNTSAAEAALDTMDAPCSC